MKLFFLVMFFVESAWYVYRDKDNVLQSSQNEPEATNYLQFEDFGECKINNSRLVKAIGDNFLAGSKFKSVVMNGFPEVTCIGKNFCRDSSNLEILNMTNFKNIKTIESGFFENCPSLSTVGGSDNNQFMNLILSKLVCNQSNEKVRRAQKELDNISKTKISYKIKQILNFFKKYFCCCFNSDYSTSSLPSNK